VDSLVVVETVGSSPTVVSMSSLEEGEIYSEGSEDRAWNSAISRAGWNAPTQPLTHCDWLCLCTSRRTVKRWSASWVCAEKVKYTKKNGLNLIQTEKITTWTAGKFVRLLINTAVPDLAGGRPGAYGLWSI